MDPQPDIIGRYIDLVYGQAIEDGHQVAIWTLADRASRFFADAPGAAEYAASRAATTDTYCCMGLFRSPPKEGRGTVADVSAICGFWADIDVADASAHKKKNLPPSIADAKALVRSIGPAPSIEVMSGYGLHAYWLFSEPWSFASDAERSKAALWSKRWSATIRAWAAQRGFDADAVGDLVRVLRVAGTINHKGGAQRRVELDAPSSVTRYHPEDLERVMIGEEYAEPQRVSIAAVGVFRLSPDAQVPGEKFGALLSNDTKFKASWDRSRRDFQDQSASAYDLSLATIAGNAGWTDQEIVDLLISWRRKHGEDLKLRVDYYQRTIGKARTKSAGQQAIDEINADEAAPAAGAAATSMTDDDRARVLSKISKALGISIVKVIKQGKELANYRLLLGDGTEVFIGRASSLLDQRTVRSRIYAVADVAISRVKEDTWNKICNLFRLVMERVENPQSTLRERMLGWLRAYVPQNTIFHGDEWSRALDGNYPFVRDAKLYVHADALRKWLRVNLGDSVDVQDLWDSLRICGFSPTSVSARVEGRTVTRSYWAGPEMDVLGEMVESERKSEEAVA